MTVMKAARAAMVVRFDMVVLLCEMGCGSASCSAGSPAFELEVVAARRDGRLALLVAALMFDRGRIGAAEGIGANRRHQLGHIAAAVAQLGGGVLVAREGRGRHEGDESGEGRDFAL